MLSLKDKDSLSIFRNNFFLTLIYIPVCKLETIDYWSKIIKMAPKKKTRKHSTKEDILKTATELFIAKGFHATSTTDICRTADINRPTLYWYFKDKKDLFLSCHIKSLETLLKPYLRNARSIDDPRERLSFMVREYTKMMCHNPELKILIHESLSIQDGEFGHVRAEWKEHYLILKESIWQLQSKGEIRSGFNPSRGALMLLGMITWITFWFDHSRQDQIDEIAESVKDMAFNGLFGRSYSKG